MADAEAVMLLEDVCVCVPVHARAYLRKEGDSCGGPERERRKEAISKENVV